MSSSQVEDYFVKYGVLGPNHSSGAARALRKIQPELDSIVYSSPSEYVATMWDRVQKSSMPTTMNGTAFELILACALIKEKLRPFYMSAEVQFVPNARFDIMFYAHDIGPIVLSAKTSLRERYKQADLESLALRAVYRRSETYLVTLDEREAKSVQAKIRSGDVTSLNSCVVATSSEFDDLLKELHEHTMIAAPTLPIVHEGRFIR